jgi:hypothetical protein
MSFRLADFVPPIVSRVMHQLRLRAAIAGHAETLRANQVLKCAGTGRRCFIVGNGASIAQQNLKPLKGECIFGLNEFFLHEDYQYIAPQHLVFSGFGIHRTPAEQQEKWYWDYGERITGISQPIINICDEDYIRENRMLRGAKPKFVLYADRYENIHRHGVDASRSLYASESVSAMAIQIAIYMGFKDIILLGLDHDWLLRLFDRAPDHFYDPAKSVLQRPARGAKKVTVAMQVKSLNVLFSNYLWIQEYAQLNGIKIVNATRGGMLDVFPRIVYEDLFPGLGASGAGLTR